MPLVPSMSYIVCIYTFYMPISQENISELKECLKSLYFGLCAMNNDAKNTIERYEEICLRIIALTVCHLECIIMTIGVFFFQFFSSILLTTKAYSSQRWPPEATQAHKSPHLPTQANAGPRKPTAASDGQQRPTTANEGQCRSTKAHTCSCCKCSNYT